MLLVRSKSKSDLKLHLTTEHYLHYWKVRTTSIYLFSFCGVTSNSFNLAQMLEPCWFVLLKYLHYSSLYPTLDLLISVVDPEPDPYWIRIQLGLWIRIRIRIRNPDPDPGGQKSPTKVDNNL
jgi:hypothetical protein